jgi:hypothetical protein
MPARRDKDGGVPAGRSTARIGARRLLSTLAAVTCILVASAAASVASQKPVNDLAPEVVGNPAVGERLVCGAGSWTGSVSGFTYKWLRDAVPVASGVAYLVTTADKGHLLWCVVTATGSEGSTEAESANSLAIPGQKGEPPVNTLAPEVSGNPVLGEALHCSDGTWTGNPAPTLTYQWLRDATIISSASTHTYTVVEADQGHSLACKVIASNSSGSASRLSTNSVLVAGTKPQVKLAPHMLGLEPSVLGEPVTCSPGTWSGSPTPTFAFRWVRDAGLSGEAIIESASASTYVVAAADQLHALSCVVIATNSVGSTEAASANSLRVAGSKPHNTVAPEVLGSPLVGETLTCENGVWSGVPAPTYAYIWVRDQGMPGQEAIGSATSASYIASSEDRGHSLSCDVTATNIEGSASQASDSVVVPAAAGGAPPQNEAAPEVSGTPALGQMLSCSEGTWSGSPTPALSFQWLRDGSPIPSASSSLHTVVEADQGHALSCKVTAINEEGVASKSSNAVEIPGRKPQLLEAPQVLGLPAVGQQLTCASGKWSAQPPPTFSYQWLRDGSSIAAATASTYTAASEDRGGFISCRVTAQNSAGSAEALSRNSVEIPGGQPVNTGSPQVFGIPAVGNTLTCSTGTWNAQPAPTFTYQWMLEGIAIPLATASTYTLTSADRGLALTCEVTASNRGGSEAAISKALHIPGVAPEVVQAPLLSGTPAVGQPLECLRGVWNGAPPPVFTFQWMRDGTSIESAAHSTHTVELADQGHILSCEVTAANSEGSVQAQSANTITVPRAALPLESPHELTLPPLAIAPPVPTAAQILATLHVQLARAQQRVRLASLRKTALFAFLFAAPAAGTLEVSWYQPPPATPHHSTHAKPVILALSSTSFAGAGATSVTIRLTSAGRHLVAHSKRIPMTVKGVFTMPHARPVSWLETVVLSR